LEGEVMS
jgi:hypothetical protein